MIKFYFSIIIIFALISFISYSSCSYGNYEETQHIDLSQIKSSDRILIFSPHPDDETLGTAGLIRKAIERKAIVKVVEMTNGDLISPNQFNNYLIKINCTHFNGTVGELRQIETVNAMKTLGLNQENIIFLGYPDGGLKPMFDNHWDNTNLFKMNTGSNNYDHSPYNNSYELNAPYCGDNVEKNIQEIIKDYQPTIIIYPDNGDTHPDHLATNAFVNYAIQQTGYNANYYTYLIHQSNWPCYPDSEDSSNIITTSDAIWYVNLLDINEIKIKKDAIYSYSTQNSNMMGYLMSFANSYESYAVYPVINMTKYEGIDTLFNQMPASSFNTIEHKTKNSLYSSFISSGISYDGQNIYLLLKHDKIKNYEYRFHLKLFNGKTVKHLDLKTNHNEVEYEQLSELNIQTHQNPIIRTNKNLLIIILPRSLFDGTKSIMISTDFINPKTNQEMENIPWRVFMFSEHPNITDNPDAILTAKVLSTKIKR